MTTDIALRANLADYLAEYEEKRALLSDRLAEFQRAGEALKLSCAVGGTYGRERIDVGRVGYDELAENLRRSAWLTVYNAPGVKVVMSANDQQRFERFVQDPPEFTVENIKAQFGDLIADPWGNILRGLAEVFSDLDPAFKSHERCKIGVKGLPKRIIVGGFGGYSGYGWDKMKDVINAIASLRREALLTKWQIEQALKKNGNHFLVSRGLELRLFQNGNGHLHFTPKTLDDVNRALAQFYGEVLPDGYTEKPEARRASTEVSKDLQYYPTPVAVVERVIGGMYVQQGARILEPSCGCGRFLDGLRRGFPDASLLGVEIHPERVAMARAKGHAVVQANFLEQHPEAEYDRVVMNPPFYGRHYAKHVAHALKFLKADGQLHAVLPVTARTDHGEIDKLSRGERRPYRVQWRDLPVGSFRESGTNINTTVLTMRGV